ncbi:hypothetical protein PanWU01x14_115910 [Parasponia andersonii]|uniref:Uncharacterized protein n=1 Tax=Parasponia andersonii TaxID=3476 RepID=A0A2P5CX08_PARAD|nr:hypothetical protein PanWU01x14_115910 [Parasponia andersonii]
MALTASILSPPSSPPKFPNKLFGQQPCQLQRSLVLGTHHQTSSKYALKVSMSQFGGPDKVTMQISDVKEKLEKAIPDSVKEFEWEKAADAVVEQLVSLGQKALKWSIVVLFALGSLSDVIFSISRNQELMMPFGLLFGCLAADFLKETSQQVFPNSHGKGLNWNLVGVGCIFVFIKFVSAFFGLRGKVFLLHVANGGFLQVLWLWKSLVKGRDQNNQDKSLSVGHDSLAVEGTE